MKAAGTYFGHAQRTFVPLEDGSRYPVDDKAKTREILTRSNKVSQRHDTTSARPLCFIRMSHAAARLNHIRETGPTKTSAWTQVNDALARDATTVSLRTLM